MRLFVGPLWLSALVLLSLFGAVVNAWTKEDHEIFRLNDEVRKHDGQTFYEFLGVTPGASIDKINAGYRKKSRLVHPDKAVHAYTATGLKYGQKPDPAADPAAKPKKPTTKQIRKYRKESQDRFARLGLVTKILRGPQRDRYDFFLKNGFPAWRGTGYYYSRFRPGAGTVIVGLFVFAGGFVHYGAMYLTWKRRHDLVQRTITDARSKAAPVKAGLTGPMAAMIPDTPITPAGSATLEDEDPAAALPPTMRNRKERRFMAAEQKRQEKKTGTTKVSKRTPTRKSTKTNENATAGSDDYSDEYDVQPVGSKCRVVGVGNKSYVVDSLDRVFLEEAGEKGKLVYYYIDIDEVEPPTVWDTMAVKPFATIFNATVGKFAPSGPAVEESLDEAAPESAPSPLAARGTNAKTASISVS